MTLLMFAGAGVVIGCLDALVTGDSLAAARDGLRLSSSYGNPNFLGFAASLGLPIVLVVARRRGRAWPAWAAGAAVILATLWLTYSRGAAIGAAAGGGGGLGPRPGAGVARVGRGCRRHPGHPVAHVFARRGHRRCGGGGGGTGPEPADGARPAGPRRRD